MTEAVRTSSGVNALSDIAGGLTSVTGGVGIEVAAGPAVGEAWLALGDTETVADPALGIGIWLCSI